VYVVGRWRVGRLVRCKFSVTKKAEAKKMAAELADMTGAAVAEVLGHTALLYRPGPKKLIRLD
jgi:RNA-binding protein YhbY